MKQLNIEYSNLERELLERYCGNSYYLLSSIEGEHYVLCTSGELLHNECFKPIEDEYWKSQRYDKVEPYRMIKFYHYYLMELDNEKGVWYRGEKQENLKFEYGCYGDSLEEILETL